MPPPPRRLTDRQYLLSNPEIGGQTGGDVLLLPVSPLRFEDVAVEVQGDDGEDFFAALLEEPFLLLDRLLVFLVHPLTVQGSLAAHVTYAAN